MAKEADHALGLTEIWSRLSALAAILESHEFAAGPDRWLNVQDLLLRLADEGRLPADLVSLKPYFLPLFCSSPVEQEKFGELFKAWTAEDGLPLNETRRAAENTREHTQRVVDRTVRSTWKLYLAAAFPLVALVISLAILFWPTTPAQGPTLPGPEREIPVDRVVQAPRSTNGRSEDSDESSQSPIPDLPDLVIRDVRSVTPPPRCDIDPIVLTIDRQTQIEVASTFISWLPGPFLIALVIWHWGRRRIVLRRMGGLSSDDPFTAITLAGVHEDLLGGPAARAAIRRLHVPTRIATRSLNVHRTVLRTVAHAGLFHPVFTSRSEVPEVLLLVDRRNSNDQLAGFGDVLAKRLDNEDIEVRHYNYTGDPRRSVARNGARGYLNLDELAERHPTARLLVIGDPSALLDIWTHTPAPYMESFTAWPDRMLLTTRNPRGGWKQAIENTGFVVAQLSSAGLIRAIHDMTKGEPQSSDMVEKPLPRNLWEAQWLNQSAPDDQHIKRLESELRRYLGPRGHMLLAAMSAYPSMHWGLTRALDLSLFPGAAGFDLYVDLPRERRLLRIARLPWSRSGALPDWLREALLRELTPMQRRRISDTYRYLLLNASVDGSVGIQLPVELPVARTGESWKQVLPAIIGSSPPQSAITDRVFANMLLGGKLGLLDFELPRWLSRSIPGSRMILNIWSSMTFGERAALPMVLALFALPWVWNEYLLGAVERSALAIQIADNAQTDVVILSADNDSTAVTAALEVRLKEHGYSDISVISARDTEEPEQSRVYHNEDDEAAAAYVADRLERLLWGESVETISDSSTSVLRIELATPELETGFLDLLRDSSANESSDWVASNSPQKDQQGALCQVFSDSDFEPNMVALPGGSFVMGCTTVEGCYLDEFPVRKINLRPFAIGAREVTVAEYSRFTAATNRQWPARPEGGDLLPATGVSWEDAAAYSRWLADETGRPYRLPSEAEWEYAARANTRTAYFWGDKIERHFANCNGCGLPWSSPTLSPVGTYKANSFGLYDMHGNASEWVQDCWQTAYDAANTDSRAVEDSDICQARVQRGGSAFDLPERVRSSSRDKDAPDFSGNDVGFRVAMEL